MTSNQQAIHYGPINGVELFVILNSYKIKHLFYNDCIRQLKKTAKILTKHHGGTNKFPN